MFIYLPYLLFTRFRWGLYAELVSWLFVSTTFCSEAWVRLVYFVRAVGTTGNLMRRDAGVALHKNYGLMTRYYSILPRYYSVLPVTVMHKASIFLHIIYPFLRPISWNLTTLCLAVTGGGSFGKCGRSCQPSWLLGAL